MIVYGSVVATSMVYPVCSGSTTLTPAASKVNAVGTVSVSELNDETPSGLVFVNVASKS